MEPLSADEHRYYATIDTQEHGPVEGAVVDNDESSVLVEFARKTAPQLPIAEEAVLTLRANDPHVTSEVRARVVHCGQGKEAVRYRFRLPPQEAPELVRLFRRRNAYRALPDPREPVPVMIHTADGMKSKAELFDISATGMSLVVDADHEASLFRSEPLRVTFRLPDQAQLFDLQTSIRTRSLHGSAIRYGLLFDTEASIRPVLQCERIMQYVMSRQLDVIRSGREAV